MAQRKRQTKLSLEPKRGPKDERGVLAEKILAAARASFSQHGYGATSIRSVARDADVDAALVSYYFSSKAGLLEAALTPPAGFFDTVASVSAAPIRDRGAAMLRAMLAMWDQPAASEILGSIVLTAANEPIAMARLREVFSVNVLGAISAQLEPAERHLRASLVSSQIFGLAMTRYVWKVGALATIPSEQVVSLIAPTVQRYLTGKLD